MKSLIFSAVCLFLALNSIQAQSLDKADKVAIFSVLDHQTERWNAGDIPGYMQGYWKSDSLIFIGSRGPTYGWQATLDNYLTSYSTPEKMGKLEFKIIETKAIGIHHAFMVGHWHLDREEKDLEGHFSLIWKKIDGEWRIVADHSS